MTVVVKFSSSGITFNLTVQPVNAALVRKSSVNYMGHLAVLRLKVEDCGGRRLHLIRNIRETHRILAEKPL